MASLQTQTTSFKAECWQAVHNLLTDTLKMALYTRAASLNQDTTVYTATGEVVAAGYAAGGVTLTAPTIGTSGFTAFASFASPTFNGAITARYALVYNASKANKTVMVLDFGADKVSSATFVVTMPPNNANTALLRSSN